MRLALHEQAMELAVPVPDPAQMPLQVAGEPQAARPIAQVPDLDQPDLGLVLVGHEHGLPGLDLRMATVEFGESQTVADFLELCPAPGRLERGRPDLVPVAVQHVEEAPIVVPHQVLLPTAEAIDLAVVGPGEPSASLAEH